MMLTFANLATALPQGAFDAWSIWNRAARFLYRDTENWHATLSPELYWENHADYPLLVPLNIAWGWKALGAETTRTPIVQAAVFLLGSAGLLFAALSLTRTPAQAALGVLLLCATPFLTLSASGLLADVPIQFFILASLVLMFLALTRGQGPLMALSGLMAGLAGWTKNEGLLFMLAAVLGLALTRYKDMRRSLVLFISGLVLPLAVILTFKGMAPPGDLLAAGSSAAHVPPHRPRPLLDNPEGAGGDGAPVRGLAAQPAGGARGLCPHRRLCAAGGHAADHFYHRGYNRFAVPWLLRRFPAQPA